MSTEDAVLTDDTTEWMLVTDGLWQSRLVAEAFSSDEGTTYVLNSEKVLSPWPVHQSAKKLDDGTVFAFPDAFYGIFYGILKKVLGEEDGSPDIKDEDIHILAWGGTPESWLVQFEVPDMSADNFFDLVYDAVNEVSGIRTFERIKEG